MQISKPILEVKITKFKLLKHENLIFFKYSTKTNKQKKLHVHNKFYAIKDGQTRQHTQSHVLNLVKICV